MNAYKICSTLILYAMFASVGYAQPPMAWFDNNEKFVEHYQTSEYAKAAEFAKTALEIAEKERGAESPEVAESLNNLAEIYAVQGEYTQAEPLLLQALEIRRKMDKNSPETAAALNHLGFLHYRQEDYDAAESYYNRSKAIWEPIVESKPKWSRVLNKFVPFLDNLALYKPRQRSTTIDFSVFLNDLALLYQVRGRYEEAEPLYDRAKSIWATVILEGKHPCVAAILDNQAGLYEILGRYSEAESAYSKALEIWETLGTDQPNMTLSMHSLAFFYQAWDRYVINRPQQGSRAAKPIVTQTRFSANLPDAAKKLENLARIAVKQGKYPAAERHYRRMLRIVPPTHPDTASVQNRLASLYLTQGRYSEAEFLYEQSLNHLKKAYGAAHPNVASAMNNLAILYETQGKYAEAEPLYKDALEIWAAEFGALHPNVAAAQNNLGVLYCRQRRYAEAEPLFRQSLTDLEEVLGESHPNVANVLDSFAEFYYKQGDYAGAEPYNERAVTIFRGEYGDNHPEVADALTDLAAVYFASEKYEQAESRIDEAIDILDTTPGYPQSRISAYALRAKLFKQQDDSEGAVEELEEALRSIEELRPQVGGGEETRASFFEKYADLFDLMVSWQLEAGDMKKAIEYTERGRARVLLDQLAVGKIDLRQSIPDDIRVPLEKREAVAKANLASYQQQITLTRSRTDLPDEERLTRIAELETGLRAAHREYQQVYEDIKNASPLWRDLITSGGKPVSIRTIQRNLVPPEGLMLLYQIGDSESHLFVIPPQRQKPEVIELAVTEEIAKQLKVEAGPLTSAHLQQLLSPDSTAADNQLQSLSRGLKRRKTSASTSPEARLHALWQVLVPAELWERLVAASEVILIPDGALHLLPFEMLVSHLGEEGTEARYWLDDGPVIRYAPSATTLYNIEKRPSSRVSPDASQPDVLSLANPIYDPTKVGEQLQSQPTSRWQQLKQGSVGLLKKSDESESESPLIPTRDSYERAGGLLIELPGTALETAEIQKAFTVQATMGGVLPLLQLGASEPQLRDTISGKRYVHLATHGLVDERGRSLFSALALTPPPGDATTNEDDGFLQLHEIYELNLSECELAVLSACQSNIGTNVEGEGVFALSRGFLAAGSRRVIGSQWPVDDASTAALIGGFFTEIAAMEQRGEPIDAARALRDAKQHVRSQEKWAAPYYWAPFILTGQR